MDVKINKKTTTLIASATALIITALCIGIHIQNGFQVDDSAQLREEQEIETAQVISFDEEAIDRVPMAASSLYDTGLKNMAWEAFNLVNSQRASAGLKQLTWNSNLEETSAVRSVECSQVFSHTRPNGKAWYTVNSKVQGGENLAYGYNNANAAMVAWMNSPTHAYNILYPKFTKMAVSCYKADNGKTYWAQEFGY